jgi:phospholipid/cholesterol/gamma-HCH transport system substrate-binding protein
MITKRTALSRVLAALSRVLGPMGLVAIAVLISSCGLSLQSLPKPGGVSGPTYSVTATFSNVVNLPANAYVRVGAFTVGSVSSIGLRNYQAVVKMRIKNSVRLPVGTQATIAFDTPLGEDFVSLQTPTSKGPYLANGSAIPESQTQTAPSVEDALGALGALLNGGGIDQLETIIDQTNVALGGNQQNVRNLINELNATVTSLANNSPAIDDALQAIATLSKTLNTDSPEITAGIGALGLAVAVLARQNNNFDALVSQLHRLGTVANQIVTASANGTVQTVQALEPLLERLAAVKQQLGPDLSAIDSLERATPGIAPGDYLQAAIDATVQVPPVPSDALPLTKTTIDPPSNGVAAVLEEGLP